MELVKFLALGYRANKRLLNPLTALQAHNSDAIEEDMKEKETFRNAKEEWHAVAKGFKQNNGRTH